MEFASDNQIQQVEDLIQELFKQVLYDEEPIFVSDEATIWNVSMASTEELLNRLSRYYGVNISRADLKQPLWKLLREINARRKSKG
jgi:hypothetical protein